MNAERSHRMLAMLFCSTLFAAPAASSCSARTRPMTGQSAVGSIHKSYYSTYPSNQFDTCYYGGPPTMTYHGGPVISNVQVYSVLWTSAVDPNVVALIGNFYGDITASPYLDALSAYNTYASPDDGGSGTLQNINRGTYGGQFII